MKQQITLQQLKEHIKREAQKLHEADLMNSDDTKIIIRESLDENEGISTLEEEALEEFMGGLRNVFKKGKEKVGQAASDAGQAVRGAATAAGQAVADKASAAGQAVSGAAGAVKDKAVAVGQDVKHAYAQGEHQADVKKQKAQALKLKQKMDALHKQYKQLTGKAYRAGGAVANPAIAKQAPVHPRAAAAE